MKNISLLVLASVCALTVNAQTFNVLKEFSAPQYVSGNAGYWTNSDGGHSVARLVAQSGVLYGTTFDGGSIGSGVVFKLNQDGSGYTVLKHFGTGSGLDGLAIHSYAGPTLNGNTAFGTTGGSVFKMNADGTGFSNLVSLITPQAGVTLAGDSLYGTAANNVFKIGTNGGYVVLKALSGNDGTTPRGLLTFSGGILYGTTSSGGSFGYGTVFKMNTNGTGFTALKTFAGSDGRNPQAGLVLSGNTLFGTTETGGGSGGGVVFKVNTDGTGYMVLKNLGGADGSRPVGDLLLDGNVLYGTAYDSGSGGSGVVFKINTDGSGFTVLKAFARGLPNNSGVYTNSEGAFPKAGLVKVANSLYGTTWGGGTSGNGTIFKLTLGGAPNPIPLSIQKSGNNVVLTWTDTAFTLQAAPNLTGVFTNISGAVSPYTNALNSPQRFFRLIAN